MSREAGQRGEKAFSARARADDIVRRYHVIIPGAAVIRFTYLLVLGVLAADHIEAAFAAHNRTAVAHLLDGRPYLHATHHGGCDWLRGQHTGHSRTLHRERRHRARRRHGLPDHRNTRTKEHRRRDKGAARDRKSRFLCMAAMALGAWGVTTSEQLVKALKRPDGAKDALPNGARASKIDILHTAWHDQSLYVPKKTDLLLDVALEAVVQSSKGAKEREAYYLEPAYWALLAEILGVEKCDLHALAGKYQFLPLAAQVLGACSRQVWDAAAPALQCLVPASIRRHGAGHIDAVNAAFLDVFKAIPRICAPEQAPITAAVLESMLQYWLPALELGTNAKKTAKFFVQESLPAYATAYAHAIALPSPALETLLAQVSACSLFGPESLANAKEKHTLPENLDTLTTTLVGHLQGDAASHVLRALPSFLAQMVQSMQHGRDTGALPAVQRQGVLEQYIVPVCTAMHQGLAQGGAFADAAAVTRLALVQQIDALALYQPSGEDREVWAVLWAQLCTDTLAHLAAHADSAQVSFATFSALWRVHSESLVGVLVPMLVATTRVVARDDAWDEAHLFLVHVLDQYAQVREMPQLMARARDVVREVRDVPGLVQSPFFHQRTTSVWEARLKDATSHNQVVPLLQEALEGGESLLQDASAQESTLLCTSHLLMLAVKSVGWAHTSDELARVLEAIARFADQCIARGLEKQPLVLASGLRLRFVLLRRTLRTALASGDEAPASLTTYPSLDRIGTLFAKTETPELQLEIFRALLGAAEAAQAHNATNDVANAQLEAIVQGPLLPALQTPTTGALPPWDGQIFGLASPAYLPVALWRMITTRWAAVLDRTTPEQFAALARFLQDTLHDGAEPSMLAELSRMALRNAQFLEQPHWRAAVLGHAMAALAWIDATSEPSKVPKKALKPTMASVQLLASVPMGYLARAGIESLFGKLAWLDAALTVQNASVSAWTSLKELLAALAVTANTMPEPMPITSYLEALSNVPSIEPLFVEHSMAYVKAVLRRQTDIASILPVLSALHDKHGTMAQHVVTTTMEWLADDAAERVVALGVDVSLADAMPSLSDILAHATDADTSRVSLQLRTYAAHVRLQHAVAAPLPDASENAGEIVAAVASLCRRSGRTGAVPLANALFAALVALRPMASGRPYVTLAVVFATLHATLQDTSSLTAQFIAVATQMEGDAYADTLEALETALVRSHDAHDRASLLVVLALLLQHAPSGTSRTASARFSSLLVHLPLAVRSSPELAAAAVALVERVCNYRALILRPLDIPRILALLTVLVGPSAVEEHGGSPEASAIFQGAVGVLRSVIRLRKDLLGPYLPQLAEVLCQLLSLLGSLLRTNVGRAQLRRLAATTPAWLDEAAAPLGVNEARSLSRLFAEIPAKTTSIATIVAHKRRRTDDGHASTTESLARSMSKHAVYILVAYVRCVTHGVTTIATPLRQELQPGLFALCDLVSKYERDAVLKGMLDASGQVVFKGLWSEWERQRYKGA